MDGSGFGAALKVAAPAPQHWLFRSVKDVDLLLQLPVEELRIRIRIQMTWIRRLADDLAEKVSSTGPL